MISLDLALLVFLAAWSFALASVEAAFYLLRGRLDSRFAQDPRAALAKSYLGDPPTLLMPVHMGAFTAHAGMTVVITSLLLDRLQGWAILVAFLVMIGYLILFRLTLPYALVRRNPDKSFLILMPFVHLYSQALGPLVVWLRKRAAAGDHLEESSPGLPEVPPPPAQDPDSERVVEALRRFSGTQVRQVMTPRPDIVAISADSTVAELRRLIRETKYSRILLYGDNLDDIVGCATVRDLVEYDGSPDGPVRPLSRPCVLVPESKKIADLLKEMQARRTPLAVAIDEYGGTAGIVTVEDIVEELVGEIKDEYDVETEPISVESDGSVLVAGGVAVDRLEAALETPLAEADGIGTVGGLVGTIFGRIPRSGETVDYKGFHIEVLAAERKRVNRVRFRRVASEARA